MSHIYREQTPLSQNGLCFAKNTPHDPAEFSLHYHDEFELTLVLGVNGKRIVGNVVDDFENRDLVLVCPNALHDYTWNPEFTDADVTVLQFSREVIHWQVFSKDELRPIYRMLSTAMNGSGLRFSHMAADMIQKKFLQLPKSSGIEGVKLFLEILYDLAVSEDYTLIAPVGDQGINIETDSKRIAKIISYVHQNYMKRITLDDIGELVKMSPEGVSRFFKSKTRQTFLNFLNNYRLNHVIDLMLKTDDFISEICYACGFNNISNFNRFFKKKIGMTPSEYRIHIKTSMKK
jgi:AraC-like DNA-binding protein